MLRLAREFFCGVRTVTAEKDSLCAAFDLLYQNGIPFHGERRRKNGAVSVRLTERDYRRFAALAEARDIPFSSSDGWGLPVVTAFLRERPAVFVCGILLLGWFLYSERLVWRIEIVGNTKTSDETVIAQLESLGFGVGTYYPTVDFNQLHATYAAVQGDIAWLSIYMHGTVAEIEVRELNRGVSEKPPENTYANVVASEYGVVKQVNVFEGEATVKAGDVVKPGDVLISGIVPKKEENDFRYEYAAGEVICEVCEPIRIESPYAVTEKRYTGEEKTEKSIKIFNFCRNLFARGGNEGGSCDRIETVKQVLLPSGCALPVWITTVTYRPYTEEVVTLTPEEAAERLTIELSRKMKDLSSLGEMTERQIRIETDGDGVRVTGAVWLWRDIGKTAEFTVQE